MSELEHDIRKRIEARYRRRMLLLIHFGLALLVLPVINLSRFWIVDDYIALFLWVTLVLHAMRLVLLRNMERAIERELAAQQCSPSLEHIVEREVARRLAEYGIYPDEKVKNSSPYAQDRAMRLTADGELVEMPEAAYEYQTRNR